MIGTQMINYQLEQMSQMLKNLAESDSWLSDSTRDKLKSISIELNGVSYNIDEDFNYRLCTPAEQLSTRLDCWNK